MKRTVFFSLFLLVTALAVFAEGIWVVQPAGDAVWPIGVAQVIQWKFAAEESGQPVTIMLFKDGLLVGKIAENVPCDLSGAGSYKWQVGALLPSSKIVLESQKVVKPGKGYVIGVKVWNTMINGESKLFVIQ